jgi:hypothetical protein
METQVNWVARLLRRMGWMGLGDGCGFIMMVTD